MAAGPSFGGRGVGEGIDVAIGAVAVEHEEPRSRDRVGEERPTVAAEERSAGVVLLEVERSQVSGDPLDLRDRRRRRREVHRHAVAFRGRRPGAGSGRRRAVAVRPPHRDASADALVPHRAQTTIVQEREVDARGVVPREHALALAVDDEHVRRALHLEPRRLDQQQTFVGEHVRGADDHIELSDGSGVIGRREVVIRRLRKLDRIRSDRSAVQAAFDQERSDGCARFGPRALDTAERGAGQDEPAQIARRRVRRTFGQKTQGLAFSGGPGRDGRRR